MATKTNLASAGRPALWVYYGKDGMRYNSMEAAEAADKVYDAQLESAGVTGKKTLKGTSGSTSSSSNMTNEFLSKWGEMTQESLDILTDTLSGVFSGDTQATGIYGDLMTNIQNQISSFDEQYGGTTQQLLDTTLEDINTRRGLVTDLTNEAQADYAGVSGRAAADVSAQSELARQDMAREAMSYGIDPTSGKFGALTKKSYMGEARDKVTAMNQARLAEKERSTGLKVTALQNIDPTISGNLASNLMSQKSDLLGLQTSAAGAITAAEKAKADTALAVANAVGDIGRDYGSAGLTMLGVNEGTSGVSAGSTYPTTSTGLSLAKATPMQGTINLNSSTTDTTDTEEKKKKTLSFG